jgi:peptidoglycan/LPS O-acetylase OafA/YrhL
MREPRRARPEVSFPYGAPLSYSPRVLAPSKADRQEKSAISAIPAHVGAQRSHLPQLDGLRGIAILLVLFQHSPLHSLFPFGWTGVDLFFVLSGFLITGILLTTTGTPRYFLNFYARRALRIWPLYFAFVAFAFGIAPLLFSALARQDHNLLPLYLLYLQNFAQAEGLAGPAILGVTWSLAIEEQFYFVWPFVVRFCSLPKLGWIAAAVISVSPLLRYALIRIGASPQFIYVATFTRLDALAIGALIAIFDKKACLRSRSVWRLSIVVMSVALTAAFAMSTVGPASAFESWNPWLVATLYSLLAFGFGGLLCAVW